MMDKKLFILDRIRKNCILFMDGIINQINYFIINNETYFLLFIFIFLHNLLFQFPNSFHNNRKATFSTRFSVNVGNEKINFVSHILFSTICIIYSFQYNNDVLQSIALLRVILPTEQYIILHHNRYSHNIPVNCYSSIKNFSLIKCRSSDYGEEITMKNRQRWRVTKDEIIAF